MNNIAIILIIFLLYSCNNIHVIKNKNCDNFEEIQQIEISALESDYPMPTLNFTLKVEEDNDIYNQTDIKISRNDLNSIIQKFKNIEEIGNTKSIKNNDFFYAAYLGNSCNEVSIVRNPNLLFVLNEILKEFIQLSKYTNYHSKIKDFIQFYQKYEKS